MTDTLEKAIDWMDRALREIRETLAQVDPDKREEATLNAADHLERRSQDKGCILALYHGKENLLSWVWWHEVEVACRCSGLTIFDMWLAAARVKAGAE